MTDVDNEDSLTKLNTQLNKSMVLIETATDSAMECTPQSKNNKSIKINMKAQPPTTPGNPNVSVRKSILKKADKFNSEQSSNEESGNMENDMEGINQIPQASPLNAVHSRRPRNLEELVEAESLTVDSKSSTFDFDDLSDSEEVWIMDIPRTIDPQELKGQTLILGNKSKFKVGHEKYCAVNRNIRCNVTCVLSTGKAKRKYKTANIKPAGLITIRRKLPGAPKVEPVSTESNGVPFPENIKIRHPLLGLNYEEKSKKDSKKHVRRK